MNKKTLLMNLALIGSLSFTAACTEKGVTTRIEIKDDSLKPAILPKKSDTTKSKIVDEVIKTTPQIASEKAILNNNIQYDFEQMVIFNDAINTSDKKLNNLLLHVNDEAEFFDEVSLETVEEVNEAITELYSDLDNFDYHLSNIEKDSNGRDVFFITQDNQFTDSYNSFENATLINQEMIARWKNNSASYKKEIENILYNSQQPKKELF